MELSLAVCSGFALVALAVLVAGAALGRRRGPNSADLRVVEDRLAAGSEAQRSLSLSVERTAAGLNTIAGALEARRALEEQSTQAVARIERSLAGSYSKGRMGENLLAAALSEFPPEMLERDFTVGGRVCEFALRLADGKVMPIDSKWPACDLLEELEAAVDPKVKDQIRRRVEKAVELRIKDVGAYIDSSLTGPLAIMAVPDPIYACCRKVHDSARAAGVSILPYSTAVPLLLSIWNLHRAYGRDLDADKLLGSLNQVASDLTAVSSFVEGQLCRGLTQAQNAVSGIRPLIASAKACLNVVASRPAPDDLPDELAAYDVGAAH
ncbi:MAG: DNA recombination protein RmuC [Actinomycetota bacterium]